MKNEDAYYLQNEVIAAVFKGHDAVLTGRVFSAIEKKYKAYFFSRVAIRRHYLIAENILAATAEEAFSEMQRLFYDNVCNDKFQPAIPGLGNYLFQIFFHQYLNFYRRQLAYKKYNEHMKNKQDAAFSMSADLPAYNKPEGIYTIVLAAVGRLNQLCKDLMTLTVLQNIEVTAAMAGTKNKHAADQKTLRCRQELRAVLKQEFGIEL